MFKKTTYAFIIAALFLFIYSANAGPDKKVFFEEHTGAWCGWCVDGTYKLEQVMDQFPGQVIPIKLHNQDAMATSLQGVIGSGLGLTGFPSSSIDRKAFNGTVFPARYTVK